MPRLLETNCKNCKKSFYRSVSRFNEAIKRGWNHFCSKKCRLKYRTKKQILKCENCGKKFERELSSISPHNYCSHSCAATVSNRNWPERGGATLKCANCGKVFKKWVIGGNKKYCSLRCRKLATTKTPQDLIKIIKKYVSKEHRIPTKRELRSIDESCRKTFGSWNKAIIAAGLAPNRSHDNRMYKRIASRAKDGHLCDSVSEILIDNWLYKNNIAHEKDAHYPSTNHLADWKITSKNETIFAEYFGLANDSPRYDRSIKQKKMLCKRQGILLIAIYPKDLYPKTYLDKNLSSKFKSYLY